MATTLAPSPQPPPSAVFERQRHDRQRMIEEVVAILSLQPPDHPAHRVTAKLPPGTGFYVPVRVFPNHTYYVHACAWARGWAVFVSDTPNAASYSWRDVPRPLIGLQRPCYSPRDRPGAHNVPPSTLAGAVLDLTNHLTDLDRTRRQRFRRSRWYFANSLERRAERG